MQQIINFIIRNKNFLLFLLLFGFSLLFTIQSHSYHKSKFINSANFLTGGVYNSLNNTTNYFNLKSQNRLLSDENKRLRSLLLNNQIKQSSISNKDKDKLIFLLVETQSLIKILSVKSLDPDVKNFLSLS